jgi:hypothetical protein
MKHITKVLFCCYVISILTLIGQAQEKISTTSYVVADIAPLKKVIILAPLED